MLWSGCVGLHLIDDRHTASVTGCAINRVVASLASRHPREHLRLRAERDADDDAVNDSETAVVQHERDRSRGESRFNTTCIATPTLSTRETSFATSGATSATSISAVGTGVRDRSRSRHSRVVTVVSQAGKLSRSVLVRCSRSQACCTTSSASARSASTRVAMPTRRCRSASKISVRSTALNSSLSDPGNSARAIMRAERDILAPVPELRTRVRVPSATPERVSTAHRAGSRTWKRPCCFRRRSLSGGSVTRPSVRWTLAHRFLRSQLLA